MRQRPHVALDHTAGLFAHGYAWLPDLRRHAGGGSVRLRILGRQAVALCGPEAVPFFYDDDNVRRHRAIPEPVQGTLFGHRAIHTLDGAQHRVRKAMFVGLLADPDGVTRLVDETTAAWDGAVTAWQAQDRVVLFDEVAQVLTRGVCRWTGVPLGDGEAAGVAGDLVAMVDGFATLGPRHWRARRARGRREDWLADLVRRVRDGAADAVPGSALHAVATHREADGSQFDPQLAAVELLNVIRPTVAVTWFVAYAAHALHRWPDVRQRLRAGDPQYTEAFAHELRRFYPFAPFVGGRAARDLEWEGESIPKGALVLFDLYGQNHDGRIWPAPYAFDPQRFLLRPPARDDLIPQGGGDPRTGHRCPGELVTVALLEALTARLARLEYTVPEQDLSISLRRIPARPASGVVITDVRAGSERTPAFPLPTVPVVHEVR